MCQNRSMQTKTPLTEPLRFSPREVYMLSRPYPLREVEFERLLKPNRRSVWFHGYWPGTAMYLVQLLARYFLQESIATWEYAATIVLVLGLLAAWMLSIKSDQRSALVEKIESHYQSNEPQEVTKS